MERADFLRLTGSLASEVIAVLTKPATARAPLHLQLCKNLFHGTHFFQELHFALLQTHCCAAMTLVKLEPGETLYESGSTGDAFFILLQGTLGEYSARDKGQTSGLGTLKAELLEGEAFGEAALTGKGLTHTVRHETIAATGTETAYVALLMRTDYIEISNSIEKQVYKTLDTPSGQREDGSLEQLFEFMKDEEFFKAIRLDGMRRECCKAMVLQRIGAGETLFWQGEQGETFHIVIRGSVRVVIDGSTVRQLGAGASFGQIALLGETEEARVRSASILANTDCLVATLTRSDFMRVHDRQELTYWINLFWVLVTTALESDGPGKLADGNKVTWNGYKVMHLLIAKSVDPEYRTRSATEIAQKDWLGDLNRHNRGGEALDHTQASPQAILRLLVIRGCLLTDCL